ncbi:MAG: sulfatase, partial [Thermoanaerobaculia bacterium]|nr:sulfatase [Thermoanaerobaculia bacterium]
VATSPWTLPSHGSMFTGLWPSQHGGGLRYAALPFELTTLAEHLREAGYYTAGFGGGFLAHHQFGLAQGMVRYRDPDSFETRGGQLTSYVEELLGETSSRPLFLFVNYFDPHALYRAPEEFAEAFGVEALGSKLSDRPVWGAVVAGDNSALSAAIKGQGGFDSDVRAYLEAAYRAELSYVDSLLGRLFATLKREGLWDDAVVVVVGDHGELLGERGLFTHAHRLDPELISIPLLIKWPGQVEPERVADVVSQVDLFPTLLAAAGVRRLQEGTDGQVEGQEGLPLHHDDSLVPRKRERAYFEEHESAPHPLLAGMRLAGDLYGFQEGTLRWMAWDDEVVCRTFEGGAWRPVECPPGEWNAETIRQAISADEEGSAPSAPGEPADLSDEDREALEALGYL